jgi:CRP-like cAMP-binding protein
LTKQSAEEVKLVEMLGRVPLFSGLDRKELKHIAAAGREVSFDKGKKILEEGEPGLALHLVLEGKVEVRRGGKVVATIGPGSFYGEMTVFDDNPRSADVVAVEPTTCFGITNWNFIPVLRYNPSIAIGIIKELVKRLRSLQEKPSA